MKILLLITIVVFAGCSSTDTAFAAKELAATKRQDRINQLQQYIDQHLTDWKVTGVKADDVDLGTLEPGDYHILLTKSGKERVVQVTVANFETADGNLSPKIFRKLNCPAKPPPELDYEPSGDSDPWT